MFCGVWFFCVCFGLVFLSGDRVKYDSTTAGALEISQMHIFG